MSYKHELTKKFHSEHEKLLADAGNIWSDTGFHTEKNSAFDFDALTSSDSIDNDSIIEPMINHIPKLSKADISKVVSKCHKLDIELQSLLKDDLSASGFNELNGKSDDFYVLVDEDICQKLYGKGK